MARKTLYCIVDSETTKQNGLVFDMAYNFVDKKANSYASGSFLFKDVLALEEAWYKEKIAQYWTLAFKHKVKPVTFKVGRFAFNRDLARLRAMGYKIIFCAYNAPFDIDHLGMTSLELCGQQFLEKINTPLALFDLWHGWVAGCPIDYGLTAPFVHGDKAGAINPDTGKPFSWNIKPSAEAVYKYISGDENFEEKHIAHSDIMIELIILLDILKRKRKMHVVQSAKDFVHMPWKLAQERCKVHIETRKNRQMSFREIVNTIPDQTVTAKERRPTILFPTDLQQQFPIQFKPFHITGTDNPVDFPAEKEGE